MPELDAAWLERQGQRFSNEDRWGPDDRRGTLHLVTGERVLAACALPRRGRVIACVPGADAGPDPAGGPDHGGLPAGSRWHAARPVPPGIVARGVLLDLPRLRRVGSLEAGCAVGPDELDACAERLGVAIESGDVLLVRTGWPGRPGPHREGAPGAPGLSVHCARWLFEREVCALATDTPWVEVQPSETPGCTLPLHRIALGAMRLPLGEGFALDELASACAALSRYEFLFASGSAAAGGAATAPLALL